jgi:hypothetical protein
MARNRPAVAWNMKTHKKKGKKKGSKEHTSSHESGRLGLHREVSVNLGTNHVTVLN